MELPNRSPSSDSSTDAGHSSSSESDPHKNKFHGWPVIRRHATSSSSSSSTTSSAGSESDSDESTGPAHLAAIHGYDKLPVPSFTPAKNAPKTLVNAQAKRPREEEDDKDALKPPAKKKIVTKKVDAGKKYQSQSQQISHKPGIDISAEKFPSKDVAKKIAMSSPPKDDSRFPIVQDMVGTPSVKTSPHRSAKKAQHIWSADDEVAFVNGLLAFSKGGSIEFPKNMAQVYDQVKHVLSYDYSNVQLYDKMRRMKSKFQTLNDRLKENSASFQFKSPHDATMFQLWRQLWGQHSTNAAPDLESMEENPNHQPGETADKAPENDKIRTALDDDREESKLKGTVAEFRDDREEAPSEKICLSNPPPAANQAYNMVRDESRALVVDVRNDLHRMLENAQSESTTLLESLFNRRAVTSITTNHVFPVSSNRTKTETLDQKWREQQILEMEVFSKRLDLLQEECKLCLEELKAPVNGAGA